MIKTEDALAVEGSICAGRHLAVIFEVNNRTSIYFGEVVSVWSGGRKEVFPVPIEDKKLNNGTKAAIKVDVLWYPLVCRQEEDFESVLQNENEPLNGTECTDPYSIVSDNELPTWVLVRPGRENKFPLDLASTDPANILCEVTLDRKRCSQTAQVLYTLSPESVELVKQRFDDYMSTQAKKAAKKKKKDTSEATLEAATSKTSHAEREPIADVVSSSGRLKRRTAKLLDYNALDKGAS